MHKLCINCASLCMACASLCIVVHDLPFICVVQIGTTVSLQNLRFYKPDRAKGGSPFESPHSLGQPLLAVSLQFFMYG